MLACVINTDSAGAHADGSTTCVRARPAAPMSDHPPAPTRLEPCPTSGTSRDLLVPRATAVSAAGNRGWKRSAPAPRDGHLGGTRNPVARDHLEPSPRVAPASALRDIPWSRADVLTELPTATSSKRGPSTGHRHQLSRERRGPRCAPIRHLRAVGPRPYRPGRRPRDLANSRSG